MATVATAPPELFDPKAFAAAPLPQAGPK